ncbi:hypothetical protein ES705_40591 [subsurface metagenome]
MTMIYFCNLSCRIVFETVYKICNACKSGKPIILIFSQVSNASKPQRGTDLSLIIFILDLFNTLQANNADPFHGRITFIIIKIEY